MGKVIYYAGLAVISVLIVSNLTGVTPKKLTDDVVKEYGSGV